MINMKFLAGNRVYIADTSFITALRYRAAFGMSFLMEDRTQNHVHLRSLIRLVFIAIQYERDYEEFEKEALENEAFFREASTLQLELFKDDKAAKSSNNAESITDADEFHIVAKWAACGLPERLLYELSYSQVIGVINAYHDIQTVHKRPHAMSEKDYANIYGITPETENRVKAYLERMANK